MIAAERQFPTWAAMLTVGIFAVFHGYAHGLEMPETAKPVLFASGFLLGTAIIHIAGVFIGDISQHYKIGKIVLRVAGGLILVVGLLLVFGVL